MRRHTADWETIFARDTFNKGLVSKMYSIYKIYRELLKLKNNNLTA